MPAMPGASALIAVWEDGAREHPIDRALSLLCAFTGESRAALASLGVHRRDALLIQSRILAFGKRFSGVVDCPACASELELELYLGAPPDMEEGGAFDVAGRVVHFRVPNSYDLAAVAECGEPVEGARLLRERCVESDGGAALDEAVSAAAARALDALCDPATIDVAAVCPACEAPFAPVFDIGTIFWAEITAYARGVLDIVDVLASRYGWSERDVLAMPDARRRHYLEAYA